jgi:hypothetical protein
MRLRIRHFSNPETLAEASHLAVSRNIILSTR